MTRAELQAKLRGHAVGRDAIVLAVAYDKGKTDRGVVAYVRDEDYDAYVVHRWGPGSEDGSLILFSGGYHQTPARMQEDFVSRSGIAWPERPGLVR